MSGLDFGKLDREFNSKKLAEDVKETEKNGGNYEPVPKGEYEVAIEKLEMVAVKKGPNKGAPRVSFHLKIVQDDSPMKGKFLFPGFNISYDFALHMCNEFLRSLGTSVDIRFESFAQYNELLKAVKEETDKLEFLVNYGENDKGYDTYEIMDIFELEPIPGADEPVPF